MCNGMEEPFSRDTAMQALALKLLLPKLSKACDGNQQPTKLRKHELEKIHPPFQIHQSPLGGGGLPQSSVCGWNHDEEIFCQNLGNWNPGTMGSFR